MKSVYILRDVKKRSIFILLTLNIFKFNIGFVLTLIIIWNELYLFTKVDTAFINYA